MAKSKKIVETFTVVLEAEEGSRLKFENILLSDTVKEYEAYVNGKDIAVTILEKGDIIVGVVETIRKHNVPPKKHRKEKSIARLGLRPGEGLAYGNVFLYEKKRKILLYEINKFGSYVNHFLKCLENCCKEDERWDEKFSLTIDPILKPDQYTRMKQMNYYKSFEIKFSNPKSLIKEFDHENNPLSKTIEMSNALDSESFTGKFEVASKKQGGKGLANITMRDMITKVKKLLGTRSGKENIKRVVVSGYATDPEEGVEKLEAIDLLVDRYIKHIYLEEPRENSDLLETQRKQEIKSLYKKCLLDFKTMFGD